MKYMLLRIFNVFSFLALIFLMIHSSSVIAQPGASAINLHHGTDTLYVNNRMIIRNASKDTLENAGFRKGKRNGEQELYYNNGELKRIAKYKDGLLTGSIQYYRQGRINPIKVEQYKAFQNESISLLHGITKSFGPDGGILD